MTNKQIISGIIITLIVAILSLLTAVILIMLFRANEYFCSFIGLIFGSIGSLFWINYNEYTDQ